MTNEQKAQQIIGCNRANCLECGGSLSVTNGCIEFERIMKMAKWKDEQHKQDRRIIRNHYREWAEEQIAQDKQQWIDKACEWWKDGFAFSTLTQMETDWYQAKIAEFRKAMKGEQQL